MTDTCILRITGSISGNVTDAQGAVVAGAKVTIANPETGYKLELKTGTDGLFNALEQLALPVLRARLFAAVEKALDHGNRSRRDRDQGQAQLFGLAPAEDGPAADADLPEAPPWTEAQQLSAEKESLGLYWSGHPIDR